MQDANTRYTLKFKAPSGRYFEVSATNETLKELTLKCKENNWQPLLEMHQCMFLQPVPPFITEMQEKHKERREAKQNTPEPAAA